MKEKSISFNVAELNDGVSGSCHIVTFSFKNHVTHTILLDCGLFMGGENSSQGGLILEEKSEHNRTFPAIISDVDAVIITHSHADHYGRVPYLVHNGYNGPIYVTPGTAAILNKVMMDCCNCLSHYQDMPLYTKEDVDKTLSLLRIVDFNSSVHLLPYSSFSDKDLKFTFFQNGHELGAAEVLVQATEWNSIGQNLFFTGDYNDHNIKFKVDPIPRWVKEIPKKVITESTYGDTFSYQRKEIFLDCVKKILDRGGHAVVPALTEGRTEDLLLEIFEAIRNKEIDNNIKVGLTGKLGPSILSLYQHGGFGLYEDIPRKLRYEHFSIINGDDARYWLDSSEPCIILTSPGMTPSGLSLDLVTYAIDNPLNGIVYTSYVASGAGTEIINTKKGEELRLRNGFVGIVKADVWQTTEFSSHAPCDVLADHLEDLGNIEYVVVVHGAPETREAFKDYLERCRNFEHVIIGERKNVLRFSHDWVKCLPSKFDMVKIGKDSKVKITTYDPNDRKKKHHHTNNESQHSARFSGYRKISHSI